MAICEATGPRAIVWSPPSSVVTVSGPENVCGTPCETRTIVRTSASGRRMYVNER